MQFRRPRQSAERNDTDVCLLANQSPNRQERPWYDRSIAPKRTVVREKIMKKQESGFAQAPQRPRNLLIDHCSRMIAVQKNEIKALIALVQICQRAIRYECHMLHHAQGLDIVAR